MTRIEKENLKVRILKLARLKSTGPPSDLALKMGTSVRSIKRRVSEIREEGIRITYSQVRRSYIADQ